MPKTHRQQHCNHLAPLLAGIPRSCCVTETVFPRCCTCVHGSTVARGRFFVLPRVCDRHCPACGADHDPSYPYMYSMRLHLHHSRHLFPVQASRQGDQHDAASPALHNGKFADVLEGPLQVVQPPPRPLPCFASRSHCTTAHQQVHLSSRLPSSTTYCPQAAKIRGPKGRCTWDGFSSCLCLISCFVSCSTLRQAEYAGALAHQQMMWGQGACCSLLTSADRPTTSRGTCQ